MKKLMMLLVLLGVIAAFSGTVNAGLTDGLVAYWPFDDNADDSSGSGYDATGVNGPTYVAGKVGQAIRLDAPAHADGQYLTVATPAMVPVPWTLSVWVNKQGPPKNYNSSGLLDGGHDPDLPYEDQTTWFGLRLESYGSGDPPKVGMCRYGGGGHNAYWDYALTTGEWVHLVFIGTDAGATLYADGVSQGVLAEPTSDPVWIDWIGKTHSYNCPADAILDELAIWGRALTQEEVPYLWNSGQGTKLLLPSVLYPGDGDTIKPTDALTLSWANIPNDSNSVYVDVWWGTEPNELHPAYDMAPLDLDPDSGQNVVSVTVDSSAIDTYYWRVNSYLNGAGHINEPNMVEGQLWSYTTVADAAPTVEIVTLDMMTWSGEGVPLDATVTDDAYSTLTIEWSADDDSLANPNLTITIAPSTVDPADATVTITKTVPTDDVVTVTVTVAVSDEANPTPDTASIEIDVYDDACHLARVAQGKSAATDFNANCTTGLEDLVVVVGAWLDDYSSTGPADR